LRGSISKSASPAFTACWSRTWIAVTVPVTSAVISTWFAWT